jgi:two-component system response regulator MtrA
MTTHKRRILLVDDDVQLSRILKMGLEGRGYEARAEDGGRHALQAAREFRPDLIVLDMVMPGKDGGDVAQELGDHKDVAGIPIIFLTSLAGKEEETKPRHDGETVVSKPIGVAALIEHIEKRLAKA